MNKRDQALLASSAEAVVAPPRIVTLPPVVETDIDGIFFCHITQDELVDRVVSEARAGIGGSIATLNTDHLRQCRRDLYFRQLTETASYRVADGMPVVWLSAMTERPLPERVTGSDLIESFSASLADRSGSIAIIGAPPGIAALAAEGLVERNPGLRIAGILAPPVGFEQDEASMQSIGEDLAAWKPDFVFVALGMPLQERFIAEFRDLLPGTWWMGVGAGIEFLAGTKKRAPEWMQRRGLEWLHRLVAEPRRLVRRYLLGDLPYLGLAVGRIWWRTRWRNR